MPISLDQFIDCVAATELLSAEEISAFVAAQPADKRPQDAEGLAKALFRAGKLTEFQTRQLFQGKTGAVVLGDYVLATEIGAGGMGVVYKAQHRRMKRVVALKILPRSAVSNPQAVKRFYREVEAAARLNHSNIVAAYDAREADGLHYLVMEYVDGQDLSSLLKTQGRLTVDEALGYMLQAARGLEYAHSQGVYHRDIKPGNLLVDKQGVVKILDMGLARFEGSASSPDSDAGDGLTKTNQVMGTVDYMAPEQAENTKQADHRSDIYALGCTLYRLLADESMYEGETVVQRILAHREHPIPSLSLACPDVSPALDGVFRKMVAKRPTERYQSMADVVQALEACRAGSAAGAGLADSSSKSASKTVPLKAGGATPASGHGVAGPVVAAAALPFDATLPAKTELLPGRGPQLNEETQNYQRDADTSPTLPLAPRAKKQPRWKAVAIAAGMIVLGLVTLSVAGRAIRRGGQADNGQADKGEAESGQAENQGTATGSTGSTGETATAVQPAVGTPGETKTPNPADPVTRPQPPTPAGPKPIDLLSLVDVGRDQLKGDWDWKDAGLVSPFVDDGPFKLKAPGDAAAVLEIPYAPPAEYDLTMVAAFDRGRGPLVIGLPNADGHWYVTLESPASLARFLKGRKGQPQQPQFTGSSPTEIKFRVRKDGREATINGKPIATDGGLSDLPFIRGSDINSRQGLLVGTLAARYRIVKLELTPVSEPGRTLRP